jgi:hypothetical protein
MEAVKTIKYKNCFIDIHQDENYEYLQDDLEGDDNLFLVHYHRDFEVKRDKIITQNEAGALLTGDYDRFDDGSGYFKNNLKEIERKHFWFPVDAYIHSGISLSLAGGFRGRLPQGHEQFDVSSVGLILASKKEFKTKAKAEKSAEALLETWNDLLHGNVYGFIAKDEFGNDIESCWGFSGNFDKSGIIDEAKSQVDYYVKNELPKVKAEIKRKEFFEKHNVNLLDLSGNKDNRVVRNAKSLIKLLNIK